MPGNLVLTMNFVLIGSFCAASPSASFATLPEHHRIQTGYVLVQLLLPRIQGYLYLYPFSLQAAYG